MNDATAFGPQGLDDTWVWEAFRTLRTEGLSIHPFLAERVLPDSLFTAGDTLEIGGGDGHLWAAGGDPLIAAVTARGRLVITDFDAALVARCRTSGLAARPRVVIEEADVTELSYGRATFARAVATHVLHWCGSPARVHRAVSELARVVRDDGVVIVTTVDEVIHMRELYALLGVVRERVVARGAVVAEVPRTSPRVLPFCSGNAASFLKAAFRDVVRIDCEYVHLVDAIHPQLAVPAPELLVAYVKTLPFMRDAIGRDRIPPLFFEELADHAQRIVDTDGVFRMSRRDVVYLCSHPREAR